MRDMMGRAAGLFGSGYQNFMSNLSGGPAGAAAMQGLDPAMQADMKRQMLFQLGSALSSGGNVGEAMMKAREGASKTIETIKAERDRKARVDAMKGAIGPNGFDRNAYMQALIDAGITPEAKELGDWASLAKTDAEAGKARTEAVVASGDLAARAAQGGAPFHAVVIGALENMGVPQDQIPALLADPQKLIAIGMKPEEAQKLALERDRFGETVRHNQAGEAVAQGNLGVAQGQLGVARGGLAVRQAQHAARVAADGYGTPAALIPLGTDLGDEWQ